MCSESFWFQETRDRHSWKYRRFRGSHQGKRWHPWVALFLSFIPFRAVLNHRSSWFVLASLCGEQMLLFLKTCFHLCISPTAFPLHPTRGAFLSIRLREHSSHQCFHIKLRVHVQGRVGSYGISALSQASAPTEGGGEHCQSPIPVILRGPFTYSPSWELASLPARI